MKSVVELVREVPARVKSSSAGHGPKHKDFRWYNVADQLSGTIWANPLVLRVSVFEGNNCLRNFLQEWLIIAVSILRWAALWRRVTIGGAPGKLTTLLEDDIHLDIRGKSRDMIICDGKALWQYMSSLPENVGFRARPRW